MLHRLWFYIAEGTIPEFCPVCKAPASKFIEKKDNTYVTEHVVGIAKDVPEEMQAGLRENFNGECSEVGMYLAMSRVADREGSRDRRSLEALRL